MEEHLGKEIAAVWNAHTEQAVRHLDYIRAESDLVHVRGAHQPVPAQVFCAASLWYGDRFAPGAVTVDGPALAGGANSPGRVLGLTERQVRDLLPA